MVTMGRKRVGNSKNVPYFSHEFVIQNHGDIATCMAMVFIIGFMFQSTTPFAAAFISPQYNINELVSEAKVPVLYTYGPLDACLVFFYTIAAVICHAIIQEYVLDKLNKRVRLSKTKTSKFNESGQMLAFYLVSVVWVFFILKDADYLTMFNPSYLWTGYPHVGMSFLTKFFFIIQMSYWIHVFPELYLQRVKKDDIMEKVAMASVHFLICAAIYLFNFSRIGISLLVIDYFINAIFHVSRLLYFSGKNKISRLIFNIYNVLFVICRLKIIIVSIFVFWFGFQKTSIDAINFEEKNFNTPLVRMVCLGTILALQAWAMWNFILFQIKRLRENQKPAKSAGQKRTPVKKGKAASQDEAESEEIASASDDDKKSN